jgi:hypothetical protein
LEFGNLEHRVTGLRAVGIFFDELAVGGEAGIRIAGVDCSLAMDS